MENRVKTYNKTLLRQKSPSEKLQLFVAKVLDKLNEFDVTSGSNFKYRSGVLEVSLNRNELTPDQNRRLNDASIYIRTGLFLNLLSFTIVQYGFRPVIHTFPRFDEPDLMAFVHVEKARSGDISESPKFRDTLTANGIPFDGTLRGMAVKRGLGVTEVKSAASLKKVAGTLLHPDAGCGKTQPTEETKALVNKFCSGDDENSKVYIISTLVNSPVQWAATGLFQGDLLRAESRYSCNVKPLSLNNCTSCIQNALAPLVTSGTPQIVIGTRV